MTRKQLAKKLSVASYHVDDSYWDRIKVSTLLDIIEGYENKCAIFKSKAEAWRKEAEKHNQLKQTETKTGNL